VELEPGVVTYIGPAIFVMDVTVVTVVTVVAGRNDCLWACRTSCTRFEGFWIVCGVKEFIGQA
jgi:hypothetical protein